MNDLATPLPCRRSGLVVRPLGDRGLYVVKDPRNAAYYHLGDEEHFLLTQLDGRRDVEAICAAYAKRFGYPLAGAELNEFLDLVRERGLLEELDKEDPSTARKSEHEKHLARDGDAAPGLRLLNWRKSLFDPDRLFTWLAPRIWFFWTRAFLLSSAGCIALAAVILWAGRAGLAGSFASALRWETVVLAWLVLLVVVTAHEFAHGLTCKRFGGEVHEVGFLLLFFMPCFYCNVSDAWLIREKSKRLWVTFAGGYFELVLWALAVFVWRLTTPDSLINHLAFIVLSACGIQTLLNFTPLLKLDGYYLLSDWLESPNLQQHSYTYVRAMIRWLLWGAARPAPEACGFTLLAYGVVSWLYSLVFLGLSLVFMVRLLRERMGAFGFSAVALLGVLSMRGLFQGFTAGEVRSMVLFRRKRAVIWALATAAVPVVLFHAPVEDQAGAPFRLRPVTRAELRALVAGFVTDVAYDEGQSVSPGTVVARIEVPDLNSRHAQKQAEIAEAQAKLRQLTIGPRPEEVAEQRGRVSRAETWRDLGDQNLRRARHSFQETLAALDQRIAVAEAELDVAQRNHERARSLAARGTLSRAELEEAAGSHRAAVARRSEACAARRAHEAAGVMEAEAEAALREKELADARAVLRLLLAGSRPEEVRVEQARLERLQQELAHLEVLRSRQVVVTPTSGVVTTARLREKVGQFVREGELICVVEPHEAMEAEIELAEQDVARVCAGQRVVLKARALPFDTFTTKVDRIAPAAGRGGVQSRLTVYCRLVPSPPNLRSEMTGYARICTGRRSLGAIGLDRAIRLLRTEFWW